MAKSAKEFNIYNYVTDTIVAALEAGTVPWRQCWTGESLGVPLPLRATGEAYRGINVLMLWVQAHEMGYRSPTWMTYKQARDLGGQVRKGEKSTTVVKYGTYKAKGEAEGRDGDEAQTRAYARAYRVFNVEQIDGLAEQFYRKAEAPRDLGTEADPALEDWFGRLGIGIDTTEDPRAYYRPSTDRIHMPPIATFESASKYYGVLYHESAHATKAPHRLDRKHTGLSAERYAKEEVVAELTAAFVATRLGIETHYDQNAAYLLHWIDSMKADNRAVIKAASMAQAACDWMFETAGELSLPVAAQIAA